MLKTNVAVEDAPAPAITPDLVAKLKKEDMKQAVVERFRGASKAASGGTVTRPGQRSPYWQRADEEC